MPSTLQLDITGTSILDEDIDRELVSHLQPAVNRTLTSIPTFRHVGPPLTMRTEEDLEAALAHAIKGCRSLRELHSLMEKNWDRIGMVATSAALVRLAKLYSVHVKRQTVGPSSPEGVRRMQKGKAVHGGSGGQGIEDRGGGPGVATSDEELVARTSLRRELLTRVHSIVWDLDAVGVSNCLWALSRIQLQGDAVPQALVKELAMAAGRQAEAMNTQSISNALYAVAVLSGQIRPTFSKDTSVIDTSGHPLASKAVVSAEEGSGVHFPSSNEIPPLQKEQRHQKDDRLVLDETFLQPLVDVSGARMSSLGPQAVSNVAWAMARLGYQPTTAWSASFLIRSGQVGALMWSDVRASPPQGVKGGP